MLCGPVGRPTWLCDREAGGDVGMDGSCLPIVLLGGENPAIISSSMEGDLPPPMEGVPLFPYEDGGSGW